LAVARDDKDNAMEESALAAFKDLLLVLRKLPVIG
jgi:hypothetical protein